MATITYRGVSSATHGLRVLYITPPQRARRRVEAVAVPGRDGVLHIDDESHEPITIEVTLMVIGTANLETVFAWLSGHGTLVTSDEPERSYNAWAQEGLAPVEIAPGVYTVTAVFDCEPYRYLYSAAANIVLTAPGNVTNPGVAAEPLLAIEGSGAITLTIGNQSLALTGIVTGITLDCAARIAYDGAVNMSAHMSGEYPRIKPGINAISWTGDLDKLTITPRWRY